MIQKNAHFAVKKRSFLLPILSKIVKNDSLFLETIEI